MWSPVKHDHETNSHELCLYKMPFKLYKANLWRIISVLNTNHNVLKLVTMKIFCILFLGMFVTVTVTHARSLSPAHPHLNSPISIPTVFIRRILILRMRIPFIFYFFHFDLIDWLRIIKYNVFVICFYPLLIQACCSGPNDGQQYTYEFNEAYCTSNKRWSVSFSPESHRKSWINTV